MEGCLWLWSHCGQLQNQNWSQDFWSIACESICSPLISLGFKCSLKHDPFSLASGSWQSSKPTHESALEKLDLGRENGFSLIHQLHELPRDNSLPLPFEMVFLLFFKIIPPYLPQTQQTGGCDRWDTVPSSSKRWLHVSQPWSCSEIQTSS